MKRLFLMMMLAGTGLLASAIPAKRVSRVILLPDGRQVNAMLRGDEHVHFHVTDDGQCYQETEDGTFVQADAEALAQRWQAKLQRRNEARLLRAQKRKATWGATANPISGSKRGLVILAGFDNKNFASGHDQGFYNRFFNQEGFSDGGMAGSVHDYFYECSYGQFDLTFDVVGPVKVSQAYSYYGKNDAYGNDKYACEFVSEAVRLADQQGVDFSRYDWDGDGYVDQVYVVYAGYGESNGAAANTIWPHEAELSSGKPFGDGNGAIRLDGVTIDTYAVSCELTGNVGSIPAGIGTACHEFSHCMCIPDFYDTSETGTNYGMDVWDLMDYGSYVGPNMEGECPVAYTSYERMYCGWLTPRELTGYEESVELHSLVRQPDACIIYNQANPNEYYLLENRQNEGFFSNRYGHGLLVLHVDFDKRVWAENTVNNVRNRQRMSVIPADGSKVSNVGSPTTYRSDFFPGTRGVTSLTDETLPAATLHTANQDGRKFLGHPITAIAEVGGIVTFTSGTPSADGILSPVQPTDPAPLYDLQGRQQGGSPRSGIYLRRGKKVLVTNP